MPHLICLTFIVDNCLLQDTLTKQYCIFKVFEISDGTNVKYRSKLYTNHLVNVDYNLRR